MEIITIDGMAEQDFRHSVEDMLRSDQVDEAVDRLRDLLKPCADGILPSRFLEVTSDDVEFAGWHRLADRLCDHDRHGHRISAIGVALSDARVLGGPGTKGGRLPPFIKTFYFSDDTYPFSDATRNDLLDGYSREGFEWQGDYQATDATLSIRGIDDLYGAIVDLEDRLFDTANPDESEIRAGSIGSCYLAALIHRSLRETIRKKGLPRPLCVFAACDGVYPFFDAPVAGSDECTVEERALETPDGVVPDNLEDDVLADEEEEAELELQGEASLLSLATRRVGKAPVLVLGEEDVREAALFSEMAAAQRLDMGDEHALKDLFVSACGPNPVDAADMDDGAEWADFDLLEHDVEPEARLESDTASNGTPVTKIEVLDNPDELSLSDGYAYVVAEHDDFSGFSEVLADLSPDSIATGAETVEESMAPPASHSLRARIKFAEPDLSRTFPDRLREFVHRIRQKLAGR